MSISNSSDFGVSKGKSGEMGQKVVDKIDETRGAAASGLESTAGAIRDNAHALPGGQKVANAAHATADAISTAAGYVRGNDLKAMVTDVQKLVKDNPGRALLAAAALGFFIGRTLSRND